MSEFGNNAAFAALRSANDNWALVSETDLAMGGLPRLAAPTPRTSPNLMLSLA
jgi:hypothetical protein